MAILKISLPGKEARHPRRKIGLMSLAGIMPVWGVKIQFSILGQKEFSLKS